MKSMRLNETAAQPELVETEVPQPRPGSGELLIHVHAAGVTPTELLWYPTLHTKTGEARRHAVPGHEFSGVIAALGKGVTTPAVGSEVYGMNDWYADGAMAEYCLSAPSSIAPKPSRLTHVEAASVPIGALTAWQGLFERAKLRAGERVLVQGGAGAVGVFAVQLARHAGAHVIATAAAHDTDFLAQLGVEQVIDYRRARFEDRVKNIDVVFDTVGGDILQRSWGVLSQNGRLVTVAAAGEKTIEGRVKDAFFIVESNRDQLIKIGQLLEERRIRPVVDAVVPFAQAGSAYGREVAQRSGRGKLVVAMEWSQRASAGG